MGKMVFGVSLSIQAQTKSRSVWLAVGITCHLARDKVSDFLYYSLGMHKAKLSA